MPAVKELTISKLNKVTSFISASHLHNLHLPPKLTECQDGDILRLSMSVLMVWMWNSPYNLLCLGTPSTAGGTSLKSLEPLGCTFTWEMCVIKDMAWELLDLAPVPVFYAFCPQAKVCPAISTSPGKSHSHLPSPAIKSWKSPKPRTIQ